MDSGDERELHFELFIFSTLCVQFVIDLRRRRVSNVPFN